MHIEASKQKVFHVLQGMHEGVLKAYCTGNFRDYNSERSVTVDKTVVLQQTDSKYYSREKY